MRGVCNGGLEVALRSLRLAYQPIVRWSLREVIGREALARCDECGPGILFELAEHGSRVRQVSRRIRALAAAAVADVDIFLNLHPDDLLDPELYSPNAPLTRHAQRVVLEMPERESPHHACRCIPVLREMGFRIALDDLGAGHNDLTALTVLKPDVVKLDMYLVRGVDRDPTRRKVIRSLASLCRDLGTDLVCEGVETTAELHVLLEAGCGLFQGFLFGAPA